MLTEPTVSSTQSVQYRLAPGYHLIPADSGWLLLRPDGCFARLRIQPELGDAASQVLAAENPTDGSDPSEVARLLDLLVAEGAAEIVSDRPTADPIARRVAIEGDNEVAHLLAEILRTAGLDARPRAAPSPVTPARTQDQEAPDVWVSCAGWLPDAHFQAIDKWCFENAVAWHGFYAEGGRFHLGPFWLPEDPRTVRYVDARARRLAAEIHPEGLEAYWRYVEAGERVNPAQPANAAEAALIAGALAADILAWRQGTMPLSHGHQLAYERATGCWRRHPVLPVPRGLMTEKLP